MVWTAANAWTLYAYTYEAGNSYPAMLLSTILAMALAPNGGLIDHKDMEKLAEWLNRFAKLDREAWETVFVNTHGKVDIDDEED